MPTSSSVFSLTFSTEKSTSTNSCNRLQDRTLRSTRKTGTRSTTGPSSSVSHSHGKISRHPLPWKRILFHLACIVSAISTIVKLSTFRTNGGLKNGFGRGTQYLTILGLLISAITFLAALIVDLTQSSRVMRFKNAIIPLIVPTEFAIGCLYWSLVFDDPFHIYLDGNRYIPLWLDVQMHGLPFFFLMFEMFYLSESFQVRRRTDLISVALFAIFYMSWSSLCAHMDGEWPYPVLQNIVCPWQRLRMMSVCSIGALCAHIAIAESHIAFRARAAATKALSKRNDIMC